MTDALLRELDAKHRVRERLAWHLANNLTTFRNKLHAHGTSMDILNAARALSRFCVRAWSGIRNCSVAAKRSQTSVPTGEERYVGVSLGQRLREARDLVPGRPPPERGEEGDGEQVTKTLIRYVGQCSVCGTGLLRLRLCSSGVHAALLCAECDATWLGPTLKNGSLFPHANVLFASQTVEAAEDEVLVTVVHARRR